MQDSGQQQFLFWLTDGVKEGLNRVSTSFAFADGDKFVLNVLEDGDSLRVRAVEKQALAAEIVAVLVNHYSFEVVLHALNHKVNAGWVCIL